MCGFVGFVDYKNETSKYKDNLLNKNIIKKLIKKNKLIIDKNMIKCNLTKFPENNPR